MSNEKIKELQSENERLKSECAELRKALDLSDDECQQLKQLYETHHDTAFKAVMKKHGISINNHRGLCIFSHNAPCSPVLFDSYDRVTVTADDIHREGE